MNLFKKDFCLTMFDGGALCSYLIFTNIIKLITRIKMFEKYKLNENGVEEIDRFKEDIAYHVKKAMDLMPNCREKSLFFTKFEEAVSFGEKAIASKEENHNSKISYGDGHF